MSADVIPLDDMDAVNAALTDIFGGIESGRLRAVAIVAVDVSGGFIPWWGAVRALDPHAGSILRGAVCWLGAEMDAKARST